MRSRSSGNMNTNYSFNSMFSSTNWITAETWSIKTIILSSWLYSKSNIHRTVLEVELVSHQDGKTWWIFEVELDGNTKISHHQTKTFVDTPCQHFGTLYLGDVQGRCGSQQDRQAARCSVTDLQQYILCVSDFQSLCLSEMQCCMTSSSSRPPALRTKDPNCVGDLTKHFMLCSTQRSDHYKNNLKLLFCNSSQTTKRSQRSSKRTSSATSAWERFRCCPSHVSYFWDCYS